MTKLVILIVVALCPEGAAADEVSGPQIQWQSIVASERLTSIRGNSYVPESAGHDWNIQRAINMSADVIRFEVRQGDQWQEDRNSGENKERSELDGYRKRWDDKTPVWGSYSFFIEPGATYHSDWTAIGQMHGSRVRSFHVHFTNELLTIYSEHVVRTGTVIEGRFSGKISRAIWHSVVFHLIQNSSNAGRLEYWLDGKKIVDFNGSIGGDGNQAYWKFGIYRGYGPISEPFAILYANMEVGTVDLSSRIDNPLPIK